MAAWPWSGEGRDERRAVAAAKEALGLQVEALGEGYLELALRTADGALYHTTVSARDLVERARALRLENLAGAELRFRPADRTGLVLVHGVGGEQVAALRRDGFLPVLVNQTAPEGYDVWLRLDRQGLPRGLHDALAQTLADHYGGDPRAAGWGQFGFLGGFGNPRAMAEDHATRAWQVAVTFAEHDRLGRLVSPAAAALRDLVLERVVLPEFWTPERERTQERAPAPLPPARDGTPRPLPPETAGLHPSPDHGDQRRGASYAQEFSALRREILATNRHGLDVHQAEWAAAHQLASKHPGMTVGELREAMDRGGANGQGKGGLPRERDIYIAHTAERVVAAAGEREPTRERTRDRVRGR